MHLTQFSGIHIRLIQLCWCQSDTETSVGIDMDLPTSTWRVIVN